MLCQDVNKHQHSSCYLTCPQGESCKDNARENVTEHLEECLCHVASWMSSVFKVHVTQHRADNGQRQKHRLNLADYSVALWVLLAKTSFH